MRLEHTWETGVPERMGKALERVRVEQKLTPMQMTHMCRDWLCEEFPDGATDRSFDEKHILHIIAAGKNPRPRKYARSISDLDVEMFEDVFEIPRMCVLLGVEAGSALIASPASDPTSGKKFRWILGEALFNSDLLLGWAPFLPCSLEPEPFIRSHHFALFRNMRADKAARHAAAFNEIGELQRRQFLASLGKRQWHFWHLMQINDIHRIAGGDGEYQHIPAAIRKECLVDLVDKLKSDSNLHLVLATGNERGVRESLRFLDKYENVAVVGANFAFWRDGGRNVSGSWQKARVKECREELELFRKCATYQTTDAVVSLLEEAAGRTI